MVFLFLSPRNVAYTYRAEKEVQQSHSCLHFHFCFSILAAALIIRLNFMQKFQMQTPFILFRLHSLHSAICKKLTFPEFHFPHCCAMALFTVQPYNITICGVSAAGGAPSLFSFLEEPSRAGRFVLAEVMTSMDACRPLWISVFPAPFGGCTLMPRQPVST